MRHHFSLKYFEDGVNGNWRKLYSKVQAVTAILTLQNWVHAFSETPGIPWHSNIANTVRLNTKIPKTELNKLCGRPPQYAPAPANWPFDLENGVQVTCDVGYLCANFSQVKGDRANFDMASKFIFEHDVHDCPRDLHQCKFYFNPVSAAGASPQIGEML